VIAVRTRYEAINAKLLATRTKREQVERDLGAKRGESDDDLEARLLARGADVDKLAQLREYRRSEGITEKALVILRDELSRVREATAREMTTHVREEIFLPAVQVAVKDWIGCRQEGRAVPAFGGRHSGRGAG